MNSLKISVIIPVYNTEKYILRCVESLISQPYSNIEIILVNDGSSDDSLSIIQALEHRDTRIIVYDEKHMGASHARNIGLQKATGDLISFIDSDDYIDQRMYVEMVKKLEEETADVVFCDWMYVYSDGTTSLHQKKSTEWIIEGNNNVVRSWLDGNGLTHTKSLIKRDILNNLFFKENLICGEDILFSFFVSTKAQKVVHVPKPYYQRFFRLGSITNNTSFQRSYAGKAECTNVIVQYVEDYYPEYRKRAYINSLVAYEMLINRILYYKVQNEEKVLYDNAINKLEELYHKIDKVPFFPKIAYWIFRMFPNMYRIVVIWYYKYYKKELDGKRQK